MRLKNFRSRFVQVLVATATAGFAGACAGAGTGGGSAPGAPAAPATQPVRSSRDTSALIPPGLGSLHQDDISIAVTNNGLTVRATPLSDDFIRTLSPDSYRTLFNARESRRAALDAISQRTGLPSLNLWYVLFYNAQMGEAPFSPRDVVLTNQARDYKPIDVIAITGGFGEQRIRQGQTAAGILVFDGSINPNQPLTMTIGTQTGGDWQSVIQRVEAERARIRARAGTNGRQ